MKTFANTSISKDVEQWELVCMVGVTVNLYNPFGNKYGSTLQSCKYTCPMTQPSTCKYQRHRNVAPGNTGKNVHSNMFLKTLMCK